MLSDCVYIYTLWTILLVVLTMILTMLYISKETKWWKLSEIRLPRSRSSGRLWRMRRAEKNIQWTMPTISRTQTRSTNLYLQIKVLGTYYTSILVSHFLLSFPLRFSHPLFPTSLSTHCLKYSFRFVGCCSRMDLASSIAYREPARVVQPSAFTSTRMTQRTWTRRRRMPSNLSSTSRWSSPALRNSLVAKSPPSSHKYSIIVSFLYIKYRMWI